jgi:hypothetical protein
MKTRGLTCVPIYFNSLTNMMNIVNNTCCNQRGCRVVLCTVQLVTTTILRSMWKSDKSEPICSNAKCLIYSTIAAVLDVSKNGDCCYIAIAVSVLRQVFFVVGSNSSRAAVVATLVVPDHLLVGEEDCTRTMCTHEGTSFSCHFCGDCPFKSGGRLTWYAQRIVFSLMTKHVL